MYSANITGGGLLLQESRILARQLLEGIALHDLTKVALSENLLQKRSPATTVKMTGLIITRLCLFDEDSLRVVVEGDRREASLLLLAAIVEVHRLVGDFLIYIRKECLAKYQNTLTAKDWNKFFELCIQIQPEMVGWSESTVTKLRNVVFKILTECGILEEKSHKLLPLFLPLSVRAYLSAPGKDYARCCMEGVA